MIQIGKFANFARFHRLFLINETHFINTFSWEEQLKPGSRSMVFINHGPPFGPLALFSAMTPYLDDLGLGNALFSVIPHPLLYSLPGMYKNIGIKSKGRKKYTIDDYIELFTNENLETLVVAPEGEYCLYGNGLDMMPFRSPGSIEIAIKANCNIILTVCKGFEIWQKSVNLNTTLRKGLFKIAAASIPNFFNFDFEYIEKIDKFSMQLRPKRIKDFYVYSKLYKPYISLKNLSDNADEKKEQLISEADHMRNEMQNMINELKR